MAPSRSAASAPGRILVMIDRGEYWQCAYVIPKGGVDELKSKGLDAFRAAIVEVAPVMHDRVRELASWDDVKLLTVKVDRLQRWHRPGLLCIGDAAHAMSPVGGVGINLAIQDAVAAANRLARAVARRHRQRCRPRGGAAPPDIPDPGDAAPAGLHPGQHPQPRAGEPRAAVAAVAGSAARPLPDAAASFRPGWSASGSARARAHAGGADKMSRGTWRRVCVSSVGGFDSVLPDLSRR